MSRATVTYTVPLEEEQVRLERGLRKGLKVAAQTWQKDYIKGHFRRGASQKYRYARRSFKYRRRKLRVKGHTAPLVWTGETRRWVTTRFAEARIRKLPKGFQGRLIIKAPAHFFKFRGVGADKVAELTATTQDEARILGDIVADHIDAALSAKRGRKRKRVG